MAPFGWRRLSAIALLLGCAARTRPDPAGAAVVDVVRGAYGPSVRTVTRIAPTRLTDIPWCPAEAPGMGDAGLVLVLEDRQLFETEATVVARVLCRRAQPTRVSGPLAWTVERFQLERRGSQWHIASRDVLEDHSH